MFNVLQIKNLQSKLRIKLCKFDKLLNQPLEDDIYSYKNFYNKYIFPTANIYW